MNIHRPPENLNNRILKYHPAINPGGPAVSSVRTSAFSGSRYTKTDNTKPA